MFEKKNSDSVVRIEGSKLPSANFKYKEKSMPLLKPPQYMKATQNSKLRATMTSVFQLKTSLNKLNLGETFERKTGFFSRRLMSSHENLNNHSAKS